MGVALFPTTKIKQERGLRLDVCATSLRFIEHEVVESYRVLFFLGIGVKRRIGWRLQMRG